MSKLAATNANAVSTSARDGADHGTAAGFAGLGSVGDSDATTPNPSSKPDAQEQFAGTGVNGPGEFVTVGPETRDPVTGIPTDPRNR